MRKLSDAISGRWLAMVGGKSPWGGSGGGSKEPPAGEPESAGDGEPEGPAPEAPKGPRNPWAQPADDGPRRSASIEDIFRQRPRQGGSGGGNGGGGGRGIPRLPDRPNGKSWAGPIIGVVALLWLGISTTHMLGSNEKGIVTTFGSYSRTIDPGVSMTLPWPIEQVSTEDVTSIKRDTIPDTDTEKLMLTSDQNLVDISYLVRWNIKDLRLYTFQLDKPQDTVKEVAEAAMRAAVAEVSLKDVMGGTGRGQIEANVRSRMQAVLDAYRSGIQIQGIDIKKADPPAKVQEAFQRVTGAQQDAQRDISNARAWAQQVINQAQGNAAEFDKVYEQYKLAPEVTKRRLYYETMERVLSNNDKVIVEANGVTPYLPLPEMRRSTPPQPQPSASGGQ